jgi:hypothetical protein
MPPKRPTPPENPDQGAFWGVEVTGNGLMDSEMFARNARIVEPGDEGVYYPPVEAVTPVPVIPVEAVQAGLKGEAQKRRNRKKGNENRHSAQHPETRSYLDGLKLGAFLPGFGPVKERNWEEAKEHAKKLDSKRLAKAVDNPTLDSPDTHDVQPVVESIASEHDVNRVVSDQEPVVAGPLAETPEQSEAPLITSEQKLAIIQEKAGFVPATHDEKNTATGLIFSSTEHGRYWAHAYLMETHDHLVKHYMAAEGMTYPQAKKKAAEGVVSRINEMGDYLQGAVDDGKALEWLQSKLDDTANPALTLEEAIMDSFEPVGEDEDERTKDGQTMLWAVAAIVRFYDYDTHQEVPFLPMTEREDRSVTMGQGGKNKQLYNPYVAAFMLTDDRQEIMDKYAATSKHIIEQTKVITVKDLRMLVPRALEDQRSRYRFWMQALKDMKGPYRQAAIRRIDS